MIERTFDAGVVHSIIGNKELYKRSGGSVPLDVFNPENQKDIYYLTASIEGVVMGLIVFHIFNHPICYQGHINYFPKYWGMQLEEHTKEAIQWMFDNTECRKIMALVPDHFPEVLVHAKRAGMKKEGYLINSIISNGKIDSQTLLGVEK